MSKDRLFIGVFPGGISYCDTSREKDGDYVKLAFLDFAYLALKIEPKCPEDLKERIVKNAAEIQAKKGEQYQVSACNQTVLLGEELIKKEKFDHKKGQWLARASETIGKFIDMADGWSVSGPSTVWLYFNDASKCLETAKALKEAGHRRLEAFPSPVHAGPEQLKFTMTVELDRKLCSDRSEGLEKLMRELTINPVCVQDLYDGSYLIEFDSANDELIFNGAFVPVFTRIADEKGQVLTVEPHKRWAKDHLGLTTQHRLWIKAKETADV